MKKTYLGPSLFLAIFAISCARAPLRGPQDALRRTSPPPFNHTWLTQGELDDLPLKDLISGIETEISFLKEKTPPLDFLFGEVKYTQAEYIHGLEHFVDMAKSDLPKSKFYDALVRDFDFYEVYGQKDWGEVFITSYYEPVIQGSLERTSRFTTPLYRVPQNLIHLDLSQFDPKFAGERHYRGKVVAQSLKPFDTRKEIDSDQTLSGRDLEICWVDPIDAFFLQIQGSGTVFLDSGQSLFINYADQNGQEYRAIGKYLVNLIPLANINLFTIEKHLRSLPANELQLFLNQNPSYVFFQTSDQRAITYLGTSAIEGRTIATDNRYFPKGALAFLEFEKPVLDLNEKSKIHPTESTARWVLDQDRGGAITGGGRVDLFWGKGDASKKYAGLMKGPGKLTYIAPKKAFLESQARF